MSGLGTLLFIVVFGLLIIGSFVCQIYVASKVFKGAGIIRGILRGTPTFIRGWKQANELGIKDIMIFWTILLTFLLLIVCGACGIFAVNGHPTGSQTNIPIGAWRFVVAVKPIVKGTQIDESVVQIQEFDGSPPKHLNLPPRYRVLDLSEVVGKMATTDIAPGQGIVSGMVK